MKIILTGTKGAVGSVLRDHLAEEGHTVIPWDRSLVPIDDYHAMDDFLGREQPDVLFHLAIASRPTGRENESWLVNYEWTSELAWIARTRDIKFIFTSTVMVFSNDNQGPFTAESQTDAAEGYGYEKRRAEERVFYQNPKATVVRLGWQIGDAPGSNNMIDFLEKDMTEKGEIRASRRWYTAGSFISDTVSVLFQLMDHPHGLYMIDSNRRWTFYEICTALNQLPGREWSITPTDDFVYDQRMIEERICIPSLQSRLPSLP